MTAKQTREMLKNDLGRINPAARRSSSGPRHSLERLVYRAYRRLKGYLLKHPSAPMAGAFFTALDTSNRVITPRNLDSNERLAAQLWKAVYFLRYGQERPYQLETKAPVAEYSDDSKWPHGAMYDNSVNRRFNLKAYHYFRRKPSLKLLDLGCSGGGLAKSFIEDGFEAVGLEGSDISLKLRSAEWDNIPYHLFTCDITEPFRVLDSAGKPVLFDVITSWEVLEHIPEDKLPILLQNIRNHLAPGGLFVGSVAQFPDGDPLTGAVYHVTLKSKDWWLERFRKAGLQEKAVHPFETQDYVRGHGTGLRDWDPKDGEGFHVVMELVQGESD